MNMLVTADIDTYFEKPYWLIDTLPKQVPAGSPGQYFKVEKHFLARLEAIAVKFANILIKLNCFNDLQVSLDGESWNGDFSPEDLERFFSESVSSHSPIYILVCPGRPLGGIPGNEVGIDIGAPSEGGRFFASLRMTGTPSKGALITFSGEDHYMTLYGPDEELLALIRQLAGSEGLFVWSHEENIH